jgi:hypothetical protein
VKKRLGSKKGQVVIRTIKTTERHWTLEIPELFYAAVAARLLQGSRCFQSFHGQEGLSLQ